jgi:hypothetical protein
LSLSDDIHKNFKNDIEKESKKYLKNKKQYQQDKSIWEPVTNLIKSINPISPYVNNSKNIIYLFRNIYKNLTNQKEENEYKELLNQQSDIVSLPLNHTNLNGIIHL